MYHSPGLRDGVPLTVAVCGPAFPRSLKRRQPAFGLPGWGIKPGSRGFSRLSGVLIVCSRCAIPQVTVRIQGLVLLAGGKHRSSERAV